MKFKPKQEVYCIWQDAYKGFILRPAIFIGLDIKLKDGTNLYHLICKTNKIDFYTTEKGIFATKEEAEQECRRRNECK